MKAEILRLIRANDGITCRQICEKLNISKASVVTMVRQLVEEGYDIEDTEEKGYVLYSYPESISSHELMSRVTTRWAGRTVYFRRETGSTNEDAEELAADGKEHGTLVVTDHQVAGHGRCGRGWESNKGENIAMTLLLRPQVKPDKASMITLIMAVAVADVFSKSTEEKVTIKWPNDVLINNKKVCGILTQMSTKPDSIDYVVCGVGINVNNESFDESISSTATSLLIESGRKHSRADIIIGIMDHFEYYYEMFAEMEDLSFLVSMYDGYLVNKDREVRVLDPKGEFTGTALGINDFGELIVQKDDGSFTRVASGEVSVRGIYGYV